MHSDVRSPRPRALLAAVQLPGVDDRAHASSLAELGRLVDTLGFEVVGTLSQRRKHLEPGVVLGEGKLEELAQWTGGTGVVERVRGKQRADEEEEGPEIPDAAPDRRADVVVLDHELSPMQMRNLAQATSAQIYDRTGVIVEIFHRHAASREARLQVEMARLRYVAPRLRATGQAGGFDRQGGGIGAKGAGESQLELDRRRIRDRVAEIRAELEEIEGERGVRRSRRKEANRVAFVGYTNAGKSSWMRALTGSEVLVADKLFATLDTTVRTLVPETRPKILLSDTVGFIDKLPHDLVASFRSTLDEAHEASLLVFVVDASDPDFRRQLGVTRQVIGEIGADAPSMLWLNKIDRVPEAERAALIAEYAEGYDAVYAVSAREPADVTRMHAALYDWFTAGMPEAEWLVPYDRSGLVGEIRARTTVLSEVYEDDGVRYVVRGPASTIDRITALLKA